MRHGMAHGVGRRVDGINRSIPGAEGQDVVAALQSYLLVEGTESAQFLHSQSVILLDPTTRIGATVWTPDVLHSKKTPKLTMIRVLFVCLANVCRSPMAEAVFAHLVRSEGLEGRIEADSAGTADWEMGSAPHPGTQYILEDNGIAYSGEARRILQSDLDTFDYIITMDDENLRAVRKLGKGRAEVAPLSSFVEGTTLREVPDPYFDNGFEVVFNIVHAGAEGLLDTIKKAHQL